MTVQADRKARLAEMVEDVRVYLSWVPPDHAQAAFGALDALVAEIEAAECREAEVRDQHAKIMAAIKGGGLGQFDEGWRDEEGHEWAVSLGRMVECPECAFQMSADHTTHRGGNVYEGYECPNCGPDSPEAHAATKAELEAVTARETRLSGLQDTAAEVVRQYHMWSEDANDGEFAIWRSEDFINSIIALRAALALNADGEATE